MTRNEAMAKAKKRTRCAHCSATRRLLGPTMTAAKPDSVIVVLSRGTMQMIYDNAKKGSR